MDKRLLVCIVLSLLLATSFAQDSSEVEAFLESYEFSLSDDMVTEDNGMVTRTLIPFLSLYSIEDSEEGQEIQRHIIFNIDAVYDGSADLKLTYIDHKERGDFSNDVTANVDLVIYSPNGDYERSRYFNQEFTLVSVGGEWKILPDITVVPCEGSDGYCVLDSNDLSDAFAAGGYGATKGLGLQRQFPDSLAYISVDIMDAIEQGDSTALNRLVSPNARKGLLDEFSELHKTMKTLDLNFEPEEPDSDFQDDFGPSSIDRLRLVKSESLGDGKYRVEISHYVYFEFKNEEVAFDVAGQEVSGEELAGAFGEEMDSDDTMKYSSSKRSFFDFECDGKECLLIDTDVHDAMDPTEVVGMASTFALLMIAVVFGVPAFIIFVLVAYWFFNRKKRVPPQAPPQVPLQ